MAKNTPKSVEDLVNEFLDVWGAEELNGFFRDIIPLFQLYNVEEDDDWVARAVAGDTEEARTLRLIRTVYLVSRIAEFHAGKLCRLNCSFNSLWKKIEQQSQQQDEDEEPQGISRCDRAAIA